jgi:hypothetical protein
MFDYHRSARVSKHRAKVLLYEERLSRPKRRRILELNTYKQKDRIGRGRTIEAVEPDGEAKLGDRRSKWHA